MIMQFHVVIGLVTNIVAKHSAICETVAARPRYSAIPPGGSSTCDSLPPTPPCFSLRQRFGSGIESIDSAIRCDTLETQSD